MWRSPDILCDSTVGIFSRESRSFTGHALIDEDYLREHEGVTDFTVYRCDPNVEPPKLDLQFHFEADRVLVDRWSRDFAPVIADYAPDWPERHPRDAARFGPQADAAGRAIAEAWVGLLR